MIKGTHLWAVVYDDVEQANQARDKLVQLAWGPGQAGRCFILLDIAVVTRQPDGTFTVNHQPFPRAANILASSVAGFLAGLAVAAPLTGAAVGALLGGVVSAASAESVIREDFIREVERLMKPGTSALFVLDDEGDLETILHNIRGLGGTVLKTNVDLQLARRVQATLAATSAKPGAKQLES